MEMSQWNSLYSHLKQIKMYFSFKNREQVGKTAPVWGLARVKVIRTGWRRVNVVEMLCTHAWNGKWDLLKYSSNGRRENKGERWRGWIQLRYIVRTVVNVTIYPQCNNNKILKNIYSNGFHHDIFIHVYKVLWSYHPPITLSFPPPPSY
jgi:hypothetical protein